MKAVQIYQPSFSSHIPLLGGFCDKSIALVKLGKPYRTTAVVYGSMRF